MLTEDWNADGFPDIAVASAGEKCITLLLNDGEGKFTPQPKYVVAPEPIDISSGDIDGDGLADLVVVYAYANPYFATFLKNLGNGNLSQKSVISTTGQPTSSHIADWNGDGILDLAVSYIEESGAVRVFTNDGSGTFTESSDIKFSEAYPSMTSADFTQTGVNDLALYKASSPGYVYLYKSRSEVQSMYLGSHSVDFISVIQGNTKTIWLTVTNIGLTGMLNLSSVSIKDSNFSIVSFPAGIPPGATDSIAVKYTPKKSAAITDTITIVSNDPLLPIAKIPVSGSSGVSVSGVITTSRTWDKAGGPYVISGNTAVDAGVTLTVQKGTQIIFNGNYVFNVDGILNISGTSDEVVTITSSAKTPSSYSGINLRSGGNGYFKYAVIEFANIGIKTQTGSQLMTLSNMEFRYDSIGLDARVGFTGQHIIGHDNGTAISIICSGVVNLSSVKLFSNGYGLYTQGPQLYLTGGSITQNVFGMSINSGAHFIANVTVSGNNDGIVNDPYYYAEVHLKNDSIVNNSNNGINLFSLTGEISNCVISWNNFGIVNVGSAAVRDNTISENFSTGIKLNTGGNGIIENNKIVANGGYGIVVSINNFEAVPTFRYNTISDNALGGILHQGGDQILYNFNNFSGNGQYAFQATTQNTGIIDAANNYWGTASESDINAKIFDYYDDGITTKVNYKPFALKKIPPYGDHEPSVKINPVTGVKNSIIPISFRLADVEQEILHCRYYY
ncbi:MAG: FG-GAP-like repeat-containing protein, partial [Bacteroidota bacterium]